MFRRFGPGPTFVSLFSSESDGGGDPAAPVATTPAPETGAAPAAAVTPPATMATPAAAFTPEQQVEINRLIGKARDEGKRAAAEDAKRAAAEAKARESGEFKELAEQQAAQIRDLETQIAARDRALLVAKVAAKHRLPPEIADRLVGDDETALDADARKLATLVVAKPAPETEAGAGVPRASGPAGLPRPRKVDGPVYAFDGAKKVAWPDR